MAKKKTISGIEQVLQPILTGAKKAFELITDTMGPGGGCVISNNYGSIAITKDGATVAERASDIEDDLKEFGVSFIRNASKKMGDLVGDGTTTVTSVLYKFMESSLNLRRMGYMPYEICEALDTIEQKSTEVIKQKAQKIDAKSDKMKEIATIAANGDRKMGELLAGLFKQLGKDSVILVEESKDGTTFADIRDGFSFDSGPASFDFFKKKDQSEKKNRIVFEKARILVADFKLNTINNSMRKLLTTFNQTRENLIIVADDFSNEFLQIIINNVLLGMINCICIKAPGYGDRKKSFLEDLAVVTSAKIIKEDEEFDVTRCGSAEKVVVLKDSTTIYGKSQSKELADRVASIKVLIEESDSSYDKDNLKKRLATLEDGIGIIYVGGIDSTAIQEAKEKVDDAINACYNALSLGILPGAGSDFLMIKDHIKKQVQSDSFSRQNYIVQYLLEALDNPARIIINNTDKASAEVVISEINKQGDFAQGFDGISGKIVNLIEHGIINPASVSLNAIKIACGFTKNFIVCKSAIIEEKEEKETEQMPMY